MAPPVDMGLTVEDLERLPEREDVRYELLDGALYMRGVPVRPHQRVAGRILRRFLDWCDDHGGEALQEAGVVVGDRNAVVPDVVLVTANKLAGLDPRHIDVVPDIVVEVSSPATRRLDVVSKRALYERVGVPEYWFVDLDADRVEVYRLDEGRYPAPVVVGRGETLESHLTGLTVDVADALGASGG